MKNKCQHIDDDGIHCDSTDTKEFELFGDPECYTKKLPWVEVHLCSGHQERLGVQ